MWKLLSNGPQLANTARLKRQPGECRPTGPDLLTYQVPEQECRIGDEPNEAVRCG